MKKNILLGILLSSVTIQASAQKVHLGIKAGANMNKIQGEAFSDKYRFGYHAGGFLSVDFMKFLGVQTEVLFNQTNTKVTENLSPIYKDVFNKKKLNYLSIPLLLRLNAGDFLTLNAGPQFSILMNPEKNLLQNGGDAFKKGDFSLVAGFEINLRALKVYGRYCWGFTDVSDMGKDAKNRQIQLGLGLRFF
jgi:hypothetical protein